MVSSRLVPCLVLLYLFHPFTYYRMRCLSPQARLQPIRDHAKTSKKQTNRKITNQHTIQIMQKKSNVFSVQKKSFLVGRFAWLNLKKKPVVCSSWFYGFSLIGKPSHLYPFFFPVVRFFAIALRNNELIDEPDQKSVGHEYHWHLTTLDSLYFASSRWTVVAISSSGNDKQRTNDAHGIWLLFSNNAHAVFVRLTNEGSSDERNVVSDLRQHQQIYQNEWAVFFYKQAFMKIRFIYVAAALLWYVSMGVYMV